MNAYRITVSKRVDGRELTTVSTYLTTTPEQDVELDTQVFELGKVTAQSKGQTKGRICYENGVIDYEIQP